MDALLAAYLPQDRRLALARGAALPEHTAGAALFADISGFTPLTAAFDRVLGTRRGAEELTRFINQVYNALIAEIDRFGGSVIGFAGDGITCWFADAAGTGKTTSQSPVPNLQSPVPLRAVACALALQEAMHALAGIPLPTGISSALAIKVAVASGTARRFSVGDPTIQLLDVLAGDSLARMAAGEHLAAHGEVLLDELSAIALGDHVQINAWRGDPETGARFAVVNSVTSNDTVLHSTAALNIPGQDAAPSVPLLRPWLLPAVYDHHQAGLGDFLTELRPVVALFLRFTGIDYDGDPDAGAKLDGFVRQVQRTLARYDGTLLQITTGDKGNYLYAAFGAPSSHEDDPRRAAHAALEWLTLPDTFGFLLPLQIGISRGVLRTGAYGADTRKTYGVLGDEVNLAARLMGRAAPGEVLVSGRMQSALAADFVLEPLAPILLKGMPEPLAIFQLVSARARTVRLPEPAYALPMVGRAAELALIGERIDRAMDGKARSPF